MSVAGLCSQLLVGDKSGAVYMVHLTAGDFLAADQDSIFGRSCCPLDFKKGACIITRTSPPWPATLTTH